MPVKSPVHVQISRLQLHHWPRNHGDHQQNLGCEDHDHDQDDDNSDNEDDDRTVSAFSWYHAKLQFHAHLELYLSYFLIDG